MAHQPWGNPVTLQVTQGGMPLANQQLGLRLFKDAASAEERYRLITRHGKWIAYHGGRRIIDTYNMQHGAANPGILIDEIRCIRGL